VSVRVFVLQPRHYQPSRRSVHHTLISFKLYLLWPLPCQLLLYVLSQYWS